MSSQIVPAVLEKDFEQIKHKLSFVKGLAKLIQIDVCDGNFVASKSWPYAGDQGQFLGLTSEQEGLPFWQDFDFEIDLMVSQPESVVEHWLAAGASRIVIHIESTKHMPDIIKMLKGRVEIGLALGMNTPLEVIEPFLMPIAHEQECVDFVQLMAIDHIGFQDQDFDPAVLQRLADVRALHPALPLSVDGGITVETVSDLIKNGANQLVVGSAIFGPGSQSGQNVYRGQVALGVENIKQNFERLHRACLDNAII